MDQYSYRLLEPNEGDYKQAKIEKGGISAVFSIAEVEAMQTRNEKTIKEIEGNLKIRRAEIVNLEHFHPKIKDLDDNDLGAASLYFEAKKYIKEAEPALKSVASAIAENNSMVETVMKQFNFAPNDDTNKATED